MRVGYALDARWLRPWTSIAGRVVQRGTDKCAAARARPSVVMRTTFEVRARAKLCELADLPHGRGHFGQSCRMGVGTVGMGRATA